VTLFERLRSELVDARKRRDHDALTALSLLMSELVRASKEPDADGTIDDALVQKVARRELKRRQEAAEAFRAGGRAESADHEEAEAVVLRTYLPAGLSDSEIESEVAAVIAELHPEGPQAFGMVMKAATARLRGRAEGGRVAAIAKKLLA
jgi:uncharacterized protein YqeY